MCESVISGQYFRYSLKAAPISKMTFIARRGGKGKIVLNGCTIDSKVH